MANVTHWATADGWSSEDEQGPSRKFTRFFWATLQDVNTDPFHIYNYRECPKLGDKHPLFKAALCIRRKLNQVGESNVYKVEIEYSTENGDANNDPNPLKRPAIIDIETRLEEVETFRDGKGRIRLNTAGDILVGTTLKPFQDITIQKNLAQVPDWFRTLPGSVNDSPVDIDGETYDARTLLMGTTSRPSRELENEVYYYPMTFQLTFDPDTHDTFVPSTGFHFLDQNPSANEVKANKILGLPSRPIVYTKKRITIGPGDYPSEPQYLDKNGQHIQLEQDKKRGGLDASAIYILRFSDFREEDLNVIPRT